MFVCVVFVNPMMCVCVRVCVCAPHSFGGGGGADMDVNIDMPIGVASHEHSTGGGDFSGAAATWATKNQHGTDQQRHIAAGRLRDLPMMTVLADRLAHRRTPTQAGAVAAPLRWPLWKSESREQWAAAIATLSRRQAHVQTLGLCATGTEFVRPLAPTAPATGRPRGFVWGVGFRVERFTWVLTPRPLPFGNSTSGTRAHTMRGGHTHCTVHCSAPVRVARFCLTVDLIATGHSSRTRTNAGCRGHFACLFQGGQPLPQARGSVGEGVAGRARGPAPSTCTPNPQSVVPDAEGPSECACMDGWPSPKAASEWRELCRGIAGRFGGDENGITKLGVRERDAGRNVLEGGGVTPSRAPSLCPATVSLTASASFNGICNRK